MPPQRRRMRERGIAAETSSELAFAQYSVAVEACQAELEQVKSEAADAYVISLSEKKLRQAELQRDIFLWEHDTTGALKGDRYGRDVSATLERLGFDVEDSGQARFLQSEARSSMFIVNLGELDRLNDESHALGNHMLDALRGIISEVVRGQIERWRDVPTIPFEAVKIHRISGNDFSVTVEGVDDPALLRSIQEALAHGVGPEVLQRAIPDRVVEPVPIATSYVSFEQARDVFNRLPRKEFDVKTDDREQWHARIRTEFISVLREISQVCNDFEKARTRLWRMVEKLRVKHVQESSGLSAETLYTKYLQKSLGELFVEEGGEGAALSFSEFRARMEGIGALSSDARMQEQLESGIFELSLKDALRHSAERLHGKKELADSVAQHVYEQFQRQIPSEKQNTVEQMRSALTQGAAEARKKKDVRSTPVAEQKLSALRAEESAFDARLESQEQGYGPTAGELEIREREKRVAELGQQQKPRERANTEQAAGRPGIEALNFELENAQLELRLVLAQRDRKTGLYGRGMYYQQLQERIERNQPITIIAMDMAFLKYFDRIGGEKTGDRAILAAGRVLDASVREIQRMHPHVNATAFRTGGDEFNLLVDSTDPKVIEDVQQVMKRKQFQLGPIPAPIDIQKAERYMPTELQFNVGIVSEAAPASQAKDARDLADELSHTADAAIIPHKTLNRYVLLILKRLGATQIKNPEEQQRQTDYINDLTAYSQKALRGDGRLIDEVVSTLSQRIDEAVASPQMIQEIVDSIIRTVSEALVHDHAELSQETKQYHTELAHQLEVGLLRRHVEELDEMIHAHHTEHQGLQQEIKALRALLEAAQGDREHLAQLRERVGKITTSTRSM